MIARPMIRRTARRRGMTLFEFIFLVVVLGTIASLVCIPPSGGIDDAERSAAKIQISNFKQALYLFNRDNGFFPETEQGLAALVTRPTIGRPPNHYRAGGYLRDGKLPNDPWGNPYLYFNQGDAIRITSSGADGTPGTEDDVTE